MDEEKNLILVILLLMLLLVGCGAQTDQAVEATAVSADPTNTNIEPTATVSVEPTAAPPTETPIPTAPPGSTATFTPQPTATNTPVPTPTAIPAELLTPVPHAPDQAQPPYVESACSDRFPCNDDVTGWEARIRVPDGFKVSYLAQIPHPTLPEFGSQLTSMTFGPDGMLYVGTTLGKIYKINSDGSYELYVEGFTVPTGLAFQPGTKKLFVSNRLEDRNVGGEGQISVVENGEITTLFAGLPCCYIGMHGPNGIAFGPDGYGYVGVGGRADHGEVLDGSNQQDELHPYEAVILRFAPDGSEIEPYAWGFRNPYDIAWDAFGQLYATDNGRDGNDQDGDIVPEELKLVTPGGQHGYPYYDCPACFGIPAGIEIVPPAYEFEAHSVPAGITTYLDDQFPGYYNSQFLVLWTALPFASQIVRYTADGQASTFSTGYAAPIDVVTGPDGSLYVADYATGIIFKIDYVG